MKKSKNTQSSKNSYKNNSVKNNYDEGNIPDVDLPQGKNAWKNSTKNERTK